MLRPLPWGVKATQGKDHECKVSSIASYVIILRNFNWDRQSHMLKLFLNAFRDLIKTLRVIFLETMGLLFLLLGGIITFNGYKQLRRYLDFGEISYIGIVSTFTFGLLMLGYGIHSFYQVRKMK